MLRYAILVVCLEEPTIDICIILNRALVTSRVRFLVGIGGGSRLSVRPSIPWVAPKAMDENNAAYGQNALRFKICKIGTGRTSNCDDPHYRCHLRKVEWPLAAISVLNNCSVADWGFRVLHPLKRKLRTRLWRLWNTSSLRGESEVDDNKALGGVPWNTVECHRKTALPLQIAEVVRAHNTSKQTSAKLILQATVSYLTGM
ncbi:uncharacterized protein RAG0_02871 [Rhynchosporium agropyri]|uniref:Uncharacterized protein n=1 Tax=Rhynchosporium agropyri TaxID=914238 RepID=A0A1E1K2Q6_9HELO|nr:uncharacterized protein RAG0_02871 [Rhynchosporium agropyri]